MVANCYFKYSEDITGHINQVEKVIRGSMDQKLIIAGGVNAKSTLWHNEATDTRGRQLESLILMYDLSIMNEAGELRTFENSRGERSNIDVTLTNDYRSIKIPDWNIIDSCFLSDHRLVTYLVDRTGALRMPQGSRLPYIMKRSLRDFDWKSFDASVLVDLGKTSLLM